jgi:PKD repeat protein
MKLFPSSISLLIRAFVLILLFPLCASASFVSHNPVTFTTNITDGAQLRDSGQSIVFTTTHPGASAIVDVDERILLVNGMDRTALTSVAYERNKSFGVTYVPDDEFPLPQGDVTVELIFPKGSWKFWKKEKNNVHIQLNLFVDSIAPEIGRISPLEGVTISDLLQQLKFSISDSGAGIDETSLQIFIDDSDQTELSAYFADVLTYTPTNNDSLPSQAFQATLVAADNLGNKASAVFDFQVQTQLGLTAFPRAVPQTAYAPVTIRFVPEITTAGAILSYRWDFDGNGSIDRSDIIGNSYTWRYNTPGDYTVLLHVQDSTGETKIGSTVVHILNAPPSVHAEAGPSNGEVPLLVNFTATVTDNEGVSQFEWDCDGDGVYEYNSPSSGNTTHTYTDPGQYAATLRVTDRLGEMATYTLPTTTVNASVPGSPTVTATTSHSSGTVPLAITLGATASDPQNKSFILWEWDFDGDGVYDYNNSQSGTISHIYDAAGTFYPSVKVTTEDNRSSVDSVEVKVANSLSLTRNLDTIDLFLNQQITIKTTLGGRTDVQVVIEDRTMNVVRTLVDWSERSGGVYEDTWDGRTDEYAIVPEGDYYAVLNYKADGVIKRLDLRETTGGARYNPSRNNAARTFSPFNNDPMRITFNLPRSSEVTAFMGYSYSNTRVVTFMSRLPLGKGSHTVLWYGTNNEGVLIQPPPGKYFMFGVWAYNLADNGVYVKSGAHIHSVNATPPIYDPTSHEENGLRAKSRINFTLTANATVELQATDAVSGALAATRIYPDLLQGANTIEWDGRNAAGEFLSPGKYRLGVRSIGTNGYRSLMEYTLQRIYY